MVSNIIIVNDFAFINGGAGSVAIRTACELSRRGKRVFFFAGVAPVDACLEATGVKVFCLNQYDILNNSNRLEAIIQGLWNQKAYKEFDKLLSSLDLQKTIIHFHSWTKVLSASLFAVTRKHHAKIVVTMHDYFSFVLMVVFLFIPSALFVKETLFLGDVFCVIVMLVLFHRKCGEYVGRKFRISIFGRMIYISYLFQP